MGDGSQPTNNPTRAVGTVDITPNFVYTEDVTILRDFINNLSIAYMNGAEAVDDILGAIVGPGVLDAREAMRGVLTQDIELQIANKTFPLPRRV